MQNTPDTRVHWWSLFLIQGPLLAACLLDFMFKQMLSFSHRRIKPFAQHLLPAPLENQVMFSSLDLSFFHLQCGRFELIPLNLLPLYQFWFLKEHANPVISIKHFLLCCLFGF